MTQVIKVLENLIFVRKPVNLQEVKEQTERVKNSFGTYYYKNEWKIVKEIILTPTKYNYLIENLWQDNEIFFNLNLGANEVVWVHTKSNKKGILVDNQGYKYARYVAITN